MAARWEVVGGGKAGGIVVRAGKALDSPELPERLTIGSVVEELRIVGSRLQYSKVSGDGPATGWVSLRQGGRELLILTEACDVSGPSHKLTPLSDLPAAVATLDPSGFSAQPFIAELTHAKPPRLPGSSALRYVSGTVIGPPGFAEGTCGAVPLCALFCPGEHRFKDVDPTLGGHSSKGCLFSDLSAALVALGVPAVLFDYEGAGDSSPMPPDKVTKWPHGDDIIGVATWLLPRAERVVTIGFSAGGALGLCVTACEDMDEVVFPSGSTIAIPPALREAWASERVVAHLALSYGTRAGMYYGLHNRMDLMEGPTFVQTFVPKYSRPFGIVVGGKDILAGIKEIKQLVDERGKAGVKTMLKEIPGAEHALVGYEKEVVDIAVDWFLDITGVRPR